MRKILFSYEDLSTRDKSVRKIAEWFRKSGIEVVTTEIDPRPRMSSGVSYREVNLTMNDSQKVTVRVKSTGDIFAVLINGKARPIKYQDNHADTLAEIAAYLDAGRTRFQQMLAKIKVQLPAGIRTSAPRIEQALREQIAAVDQAIAEAEAELAA